MLGALARNADGLRRLCSWARTDVSSAMYESAESRAANIERLARQERPLLEDVASSAERLVGALAELDGTAWARTVRRTLGVWSGAPPSRVLGSVGSGSRRSRSTTSTPRGYSPAD